MHQKKWVFFLYRLKICVYLYKDRFNLDRVDLNFVSFYNKSNYLLDIKRKKYSIIQHHCLQRDTPYAVIINVENINVNFSYKSNQFCFGMIQENRNYFRSNFAVGNLFYKIGLYVLYMCYMAQYLWWWGSGVIMNHKKTAC